VCNIGSVASTGSIAVIIPVHNRIQLLSKVLDSVLAQTAPGEIFVMDDASSDGTGEMIRQNYPNVRYYREEKSKGPTFQRNKAAAMTRATILCTIDDDCLLQSKHTFEQTLAAFDHPRIGAVTMPFINTLQNGPLMSAAPDSSQIWTSNEYWGGMVAIRRDVYLGVGGYRPYMFIQTEESDMSIRMLQAGYVVRWGSADPIHHLESPLRDNPRRHRQGPRNNILYAYYNIPSRYLPGHLILTSALCLKFGFKIGHPVLAAQGLLQGYRGILHEWHERAPVSPAIYRLTRKYKREGPLPLSAVEPLLPPIKNFPSDN
jgi:glycosyltransferase involved in cell wall biosynthesis